MADVVAMTARVTEHLTMLVEFGIVDMRV
jgi:hypothetical protein